MICNTVPPSVTRAALAGAMYLLFPRSSAPHGGLRAFARWSLLHILVLDDSGISPAGGSRPSFSLVHVSSAINIGAGDGIAHGFGQIETAGR